MSSSPGSGDSSSPPEATHAAECSNKHAAMPNGGWRSPVTSPGLMGRLNRILSTLRYHHLQQLLRRSFELARKKLPARHGDRYVIRPTDLPNLRDEPGLVEMAGRKLATRRSRNAGSDVSRFQDGCFRFLNREVQLSPGDWRLSEQGDLPHLWRFHFHYHDFLLDAAMPGLDGVELPSIEEAWRFALSWIDGNPLTYLYMHRDAWHPFCISRRLPVWVSLWTIAPPTPGARERVLGSLLQQARFLNRHLEWDPGGNHLVENLRALAISAAFMDGAESEGWIRTIRQVLPDQLREQVLEHGEHFERSPMYHSHMLDAVLDIRDAFQQIAPEISELCSSVAVRMSEFLKEILHPDGEIPLLGDSVLKEAPSATILIGAPNQNVPPTQISEASANLVGPYWIWKEQECRQLLFDAGPVGADHLPAHAHCDLLNLEISIAKQRVVVDTGVYNYAGDAARQHCRSTAAHNTLQIDGQDQCDVWSSFRMGYRGHPTQIQTGEQHGFSWAKASHDGYRRIGVPSTKRLIACRRGGPWIIVDWAVGTGTHRLTNRLHLHPDVQIIDKRDSTITLAVGDSRLFVTGLGDGELTVEEDWYCPEFGQRLAAPVLVWEATLQLPAVCGWCFTWNNDDDVPSVTIDQGTDIMIRVDDGKQPWHWKIPI